MSFLPLLATAALAIGLAMLALWLLSLRLRDASIVDAFWGPGFAVIGLLGGALGAAPPARRLLLAALVTIWGLRLGGYLLWRNHGHGEDPRYAAMRRRHGERFGRVSLVSVFGLQGALMLVVALPVLVGQSATTAAGPGPLEALGCALWACGLALETVGDAQLARFRSSAANAGRVLDRGLWSWTRHPNYFGDFLVWWGIFLVSLPVPGGAAAIVGPLAMSFLLMRVSGVPLLERRLARTRPDYADYVARTSAFFPRPPRRSSKA